jgi:hypothetical protein
MFGTQNNHAYAKNNNNKYPFEFLLTYFVECFHKVSRSLLNLKI